MKIFKLLLVLLFTVQCSFGQEKNTKTPLIEFVGSPKILYRGIYNKIRIRVPETDSIQLYDTKKGEIVKDKTTDYYSIECTYTKSNTKTYIIKSYLNGLHKKTDSINFEIENIDRPRLKIADYYGKYLKMSIEELKNAKLEVFTNSFLLDHSIRVSGYKIKIGSGDVLKIKGDMISNDVYSEMKKLDIGEEILIFDVSYNSTKFCCGKRPHPISIELMDIN